MPTMLVKNARLLATMDGRTGVRFWMGECLLRMDLSNK